MHTNLNQTKGFLTFSRGIKIEHWPKIKDLFHVLVVEVEYWKRICNKSTTRLSLC